MTTTWSEWRLLVRSLIAWTLLGWAHRVMRADDPDKPVLSATILHMARRREVASW